MIAQIDRKMQTVFVLILFLLDSVVVTRGQHDGVNDNRHQSRRRHKGTQGQKLLIIVIDG